MHVELNITLIHKNKKQMEEKKSNFVYTVRSVSYKNLDTWQTFDDTTWCKQNFWQNNPLPDIYL